jgi:hypothetical protein
MLKNIGLPILIPLITPISAIAIQPSASASTVFCNKTNSPIRVAYARGTLDPTLSIETANYEVKGWLKIAPGACMTADVGWAMPTNTTFRLKSHKIEHKSKMMIKNISRSILISLITAYRLTY